LTRSNIDSRLLKIEMELNSIEAIKNAVQSGLGASFVSISAIEKELKLGVLKRVSIENVVIKRPLSLILNPNRYRSKASEIFIEEVLPQLANQEALLAEELLAVAVE
jgi:DNA-binding transcriptional LysR family regulator